MIPFKTDLQAVEALVFAHKGKDVANYTLKSKDRLYCPNCCECDTYSTMWEVSQIIGESGKRKAYRAVTCENCGTDAGTIDSYKY